MTRGMSTTTECVSAWSDLMDAGSKDCASATSVVQTIPPMNQSGSSARFMRDDYSHRQVGVVGLVWLNLSATFSSIQKAQQNLEL